MKTFHNLNLTLLLLPVFVILVSFCFLLNTKARNFESKTIYMQINNPYMKINGQKKEVDLGRLTTPVIINDRTFIPIRTVIEEINGTIQWVENCRQVRINYNNHSIILQIDNNIINVDGNNINYETAPFILNERTFLPLRFIMENLGLDVEWNEKDRTIKISTLENNISDNSSNKNLNNSAENNISNRTNNSNNSLDSNSNQNISTTSEILPNSKPGKTSFEGDLRHQVLGFLQEYSSDGYYIVTTNETAEGVNISGNDYYDYTDGKFNKIDTLVHESCHGLNNINAGKKIGYESYFLGNQKFIVIQMLDIFRSDLIASSIPPNYRTFRYNTYVKNRSENLGSQVNGIYGLLEEFDAYYNGCKATFDTYGYYLATNEWNDYAQEMQSFAAYFEFKYFILHYLKYAKENYPEVYNNLISQQELKEAYSIIEAKYRQVVNSYLKQIEENNQLKNSHIMGYDIYQKLEPVLQTNEYKSLHNTLIN